MSYLSVPAYSINNSYSYHRGSDIRFASKPAAKLTPPEGIQVRLNGNLEIKQLSASSNPTDGDIFEQEQLKKLYAKYLTTYNRKDPSKNVLARTNKWLDDIFRFPQARVFLATYPVISLDGQNTYSLPAGFAIGWAQPEPSEVSTFYWHNLFVDESVRTLGAGVATQLTTALIAKVWTDRFSKINMKTHETNNASQALYGDPKRQWPNGAHFTTNHKPDGEGFVPYMMRNPRMKPPGVQNQSTTRIVQTKEERESLRGRNPVITMVNGVAAMAFI